MAWNTRGRGLRRINHSRRIDENLTEKKTRPSTGDLVRFKYRRDRKSGYKIWDKQPIVYITGKKGTVKGEMLQGFNINYLTTALVNKLLAEKNLMNLKRYEQYEHAYRTYSMSKAGTFELINYKTDIVLRQERREEHNLPAPPVKPPPRVADSKGARKNKGKK
tara:strand:- start:500 stop:988 length:489 start_codon:yes stop_codon:yes gene_type:complete